MDRRSTKGPKQRVNIAKARETARELRNRRGGRLKVISRSDRKRLLGHFGPPVKRGAAKRGAKKGGKRRAA